MELIYDLSLETITPPLFMLPWIGQNFSKTKVLFLGESEYDDGTEFHKKWKREWITSQRITDIKTDSRLLNKIDQTILSNNFSAESQKILWSSVAYTNLVQRAMNWQENKIDKPTDEDLIEGWETILKVLLVMKPTMIVKWGILGDGVLRGFIHNKTFKDWKFETINNNRFLLLKHNSGYSARILFVHHPSWRFFNANKVSETINTKLPELNLLITQSMN